jgi:predicted nucleic acid-binding protein
MNVDKRLAFFDTNVLVYGDDHAKPEKRSRANALIAEHSRRKTFVISLQVLQEYFATLTRKLGVEAQVAQRQVQILAQERVVRFHERDIIAAIELHRLNRISFWDALIVHAARLCGASVLYSEDFQHGAVVAGVRVENPFQGL